MLGKILRFLLVLWLITLGLTLLYRWIPVPLTPLMVLRLLEEPQPDQDHRWYRDWVPIEEVSPHLVQAAVAAEDQHFMSHNGFDLDAIQKAYRRNQSGKKQKLGGSTISQQTAKKTSVLPQAAFG
mgnify:FL=1